MITEVPNNPSLLNRFLYVGSKITGTSPYWYQRRLELEAMVTQLGVPKIFLTLSAADLLWKCLVNHFDYDVSAKTETTIARDMQLLSKNPLIADEYFGKRVELFVLVLRKKLKIKDYWYRFECQHRGSPHIHGVFWIDGAPDVRTFHTMNADELLTAKSFYDDLISCWNPYPAAEKAMYQPSRLTVEESNLNDECN